MSDETGADVTADVRLAIAKALYFGHRCCSGCFSCDYDKEWPENGIYSMGYDGGQWSEGTADDILELIKPLVDAAVAEALAAERAKPRRRQRIAVLGATYEDAKHEAQYLPREAEVALLSARAPDPHAHGHGQIADALFITPSALILEAARIERLLPSLTPMFATRQRPEATS